MTEVAPDFNPTGTNWGGISSAGDSFTIYQLAGRSRTWPEPTYISSSWPFTSGSVLLEVGLFATWSDSIGERVTAGGVELRRPAPFGIDQSAAYALDQTIAEWRPVNTGDPWFAQLQVQSAGPAAFRLCWHARLPQVLRLWCTVNDRSTGAHQGIHVVDDSLGMGPKTWSTIVQPSRD